MAMSLLESPQVIKSVYDPDNDGCLRVNVVAGAATVTIDSEIVDDSAFTPAVSQVLMVGAMYDDVAPDSVNEGDGGAFRMSANRNLYGTIRDAAGNERGANVTASNALVVDGSAVTQPVSATSLPLPSGAATESTLSAASGKLPATLGQKAMTASMAVVVASDQSAIPASQSGTWNITNVSGTVSLPSGASTAANQSTANTTLSAIQTSVEILDDWDESDRAKVNIIVGQTGVQGASGTVSANTQRVVLATDVALPTGSNVIGGVTQSGTWTVVSAGMTVVDFIDTTPVLDTSGTNIPASGSNPVQVVATLAANVKKLKFDWASGEFVGVYTGVALSEVLVGIIGPGSDSTLDVTISAGARISLRNMANATISAGKLAIQFIG